MADTKTKVIAGEEFQVTQPYAAGHTLTEIEAKVLNQVRSENIANNMRKAVKEAIEEGTLDKVRGLVTEYDAQYEFTTPSAGGGRKMDPVEREAHNIARAAIRERLAQDGRKLKDVDPEKLAAAVENLIESNDEIMKLAKKRVADKQKVADVSTADLGL